MSYRRRGVLLGGILLALPALVAVPAAADPTSSPTPAEATSGASSSSTGSAAASPSTSESAAASTPAQSTPAPSTPAPSTPAPSTPAPSTPISSTPTASTSTSGSAAAHNRSAQRSAATATFTLKVTSDRGDQQYFQDVGSFRFSGRVDGDSAGQRVVLWHYSEAAKTWYAEKTAPITTGSDHSYRGSVPITWTASGLRFCATLGNRPDIKNAATTACAAPVTVKDSTITLSSKFRSINALTDPVITGSVTPARAGVRVNVDVRRDGKYRAAVSTTTAANGTWRATLTWGHGSLTDYKIRAAYKAANRPRWEASSSLTFTRVAVLDAKVAKTTSADVAKTYRSGCPVGPSKLRTVSLNYYGMSDHKMHRGVIIIRSSLTDDLIRGFGSALKKRYPIAKINNPNVYGGNDPKQMEANNTSGFNCRKVTGNPYAQSPHSYGTALDVNTVQNPYRDVHGKWWPKNGKKYIDRSPLKAGMLSKNSTLTKSLRKDKFFWGGFWNPGRDYQHFQR